MMDIAGLLLKEIEISRHFTTQGFYVFMLVFSVFALYAAWKYRLFRFSLLMWLSVAIIGFIWEAVLFASGIRQYSFLASLELVYHAITEGGPGLIIMAIFADWTGIIDLSDFKEDR